MNETSAPPWRTSSLSAAGNCVEVQAVQGGGARVRNTRDRDGGTLEFTAAEWDAFIGGAKLGEFDG